MKRLIILLCVFVFAEFTITHLQFKEKESFNWEIKTQPTYNVTATMYNAVEGQCDADPLITAGMYKINPHKASDHKWIAVSRDLLKRWNGSFQYGDLVEIRGTGKKDGIYTIVDTMNARYKNRIDILETVGTPLYKYKNVIITKVSNS